MMLLENHPSSSIPKVSAPNKCKVIEDRLMPRSPNKKESSRVK